MRSLAGLLGCAALLLLGCGGQSVKTDDRAQAVNDNRVPLSAETEWFAPGEPYGLLGPGLLSFSPDGRRLVTQGGAYEPIRSEFEVATGALLERSEIPTGQVLFARDSGWRRELRGSLYGPGALHVIELESGSDAFSVELEEGVLAAALSDDGRYVGTLQCRAGALVASRYDTGPRDVRQVPSGNCALGSEHAVFDFVEQGRAALLAYDTSGTVTRVYFAEGTATAHAVHAPTTTRQSVLGFALSPDESLGVSQGTDDVRFWRYPDFEPLLGPLAVSATPTYAGCFVPPRTLGALAWSPDGTLVAVSEGEGRLGIRRAADFEPLLTLEAEQKSACEQDSPTPPGLAAFAPAGDRIAVWWGGMIGMFRLF